MFADMEKPKTKQTKRQQRLKGPCLSPQARQPVLPLRNRPAAVPLDEWELYNELACELEGAECFADDIRQRLQKVKEHLARRIEDRHSPVHDKSLEHLVTAVPITDLLQ